eukprot:403355043
MLLIGLIGLSQYQVQAHGDHEDEHELHSSARLKKLTGERFDAEVMDPVTSRLRNGPWMIKFYAPWCGHCKRLAPIWDDFADKYGDQINVGLINCDEKDISGVCSQFDVTGYPSLLFLKGRYFYKYSGERSVEAFGKFALEGGYEQAEKEDLPKKMEGFELYQKQLQKFLNQLAKSTEMLFDKIGFGHLPHGVMYGIAASAFIIPIILMCWVICCMKDDYVDAEEKQQEQQQQQRKPVSARREKIE